MGTEPRQRALGWGAWGPMVSALPLERLESGIGPSTLSMRWSPRKDSGPQVSKDSTFSFSSNMCWALAVFLQCRQRFDRVSKKLPEQLALLHLRLQCSMRPVLRGCWEGNTVLTARGQACYKLGIQYPPYSARLLFPWLIFLCSPSLQ